jgi:hypothetical protein
MVAVLARGMSRQSQKRLPRLRQVLILVREKLRTKRYAKNSSDIWQAVRQPDPLKSEKRNGGLDNKPS